MTMSVWVKICGVTRYDDVLDDASAVGLMFYPRSSRFITADIAASIANALPPRVLRVGVFVDSKDDVMEHIMSFVTLDAIQLHGYEDDARIRHVKERFGVKVFKAVTIKTRADIARAADYPSADMMLLDSRGETRTHDEDGKTFNWHWLKNAPLPKAWCLAGGITPANLQEAVNASGATHVDVSSGVESSEGVKDARLIKDLLARARRL